MVRPVDNPPNPWSKAHVEWLDEPPPATLAIFEEEARSVLSENESPDVGFRWSVNPYRGCLHACAYCYARPSHQYLGWGAGTDFDRKLVVKKNAPDVLRKELSRPSWKGETIVFSGNTDCYQALEASYELTRRCLEICLEFQNPIGIITKSVLVRRDAALLAELAQRARAHVTVSIAFASDEDARKIEPFASRPSRRFEAIRALTDAGVPTSVLLAPIIPGLNDADIPDILTRAKEAGALGAGIGMLRLAAEVRPVFMQRLAEAFPDRVRKVENAIRDVRGGKMNESAFGARFEGTGPRWAAITSLFELHRRKLGLDAGRMDVEDVGDDRPTTFRRPTKQRSLFDL